MINEEAIYNKPILEKNLSMLPVGVERKGLSKSVGFMQFVLSTIMIGLFLFALFVIYTHKKSDDHYIALILYVKISFALILMLSVFLRSISNIYADFIHEGPILLFEADQFTDIRISAKAIKWQDINGIKLLHSSKKNKYFLFIYFNIDSLYVRSWRLDLLFRIMLNKILGNKGIKIGIDTMFFYCDERELADLIRRLCALNKR